MNRCGYHKQYSDGMQTFVMTGQENNHSISHAIAAAERREKDRQEMIDNFIPSFEFVGAEMPLNRACRQLMTDELFPKGCRHEV